MNLTVALTIFSGISLLFYGITCLVSENMIEEFKRYRLPQFRIVVGSLEILGGLGLLVGLYEPVLGVVSAAGLAILLFCGFVVRVIIKYGILESIPALFFFLLNLFLAFEFFASLR